MKNMERLCSILIIGILSVGLVGCGGVKPSKVVSEYFNEVKKGDKVKSNELLKNSMEEGSKKNTEDAEGNEVSDEVSNLLSESVKKLTLKINNETVDGEKATVNVTVEGDNIAMAMGDAITKSFGLVFQAAFTNPDMTDEERDRIMNDAMIESFKNIISDKRTGDITLTKSDKEWTIESNNELNRLILGEAKLTTD
ncbi:DUF4878 domain-containing protein [Clostridium gasigenes]|uniref:DUF4878 domain-containing protein n=1 Tax=Clostridium gasigenes TaxID=94869 RepID=UPI001C0CBBD9|nr:DUF4878 domain-containing protein [Clostridium gasigenes]MBU3090371.1 DUF4878 domain-containing protein [Clostridium gasigenes]